jgi:uncharacterized tellurite resistance protein B-like protein
MSNTSVIMSLAKVLVAAAWADGTITNDETNSLKDLLFHMPGMTAQDWAEIDIYVESPVEEAERQRLITELEERLSSVEEKNLVIQALDQLVETSDGVGEAELMVVNEIKAEIQNAKTGSSHRWNLFARSSVKQRSESLQNLPNRELFLDDFVKNKIFYDVNRRLKIENSAQVISESELRKLCLAGGLLARIAYVDGQIKDVEAQVIQQGIQRFWMISEVEAALVLEVALSNVSQGLDLYRLNRQFFECTSDDERLRFLNALFVVAASDGFVTNDEIEEIRSIALGLLMTHEQFIDAKLKIPREQREI